MQDTSRSGLSETFYRLVLGFIQGPQTQESLGIQPKYLVAYQYHRFCGAERPALNTTALKVDTSLRSIDCFCVYIWSSETQQLEAGRDSHIAKTVKIRGDSLLLSESHEDCAKILILPFNLCFLEKLEDVNFHSDLFPLVPQEIQFRRSNFALK